MIANHILVQRIEEKFTQYYCVDGEYRWDFLTRKQCKADVTETFPIEIEALDRNEARFIKMKMTSEMTLLFNKNKKLFTYTENYVVKEGTLIAIVFPKNYIPISLGFGKKTMIQNGTKVNASSPGGFDILYNSMEKITTIVFTIENKTNFQFTCCGAYSESFPSSIGNFKGDLEAVVKMNSKDGNAITAKDLTELSEYFKEDIHLIDIAKSLNELRVLWDNKDEKDLKITQDGIMSQIANSFSEKMSLASSGVTLIDSYLNGGVISKLIVALLLLIKYRFNL